MSRPRKLKPEQKERVSSRLQMRFALLTQLTEYSLKQIASTEGISYAIVWRLNAALNGKRNYKSRTTVEIPATPLED